MMTSGLGVIAIAWPGVTVLALVILFAIYAFIDAGARTERPEENGMAHFLEHLVFKGGEKYETYRDVNETAERLGAQLNAYTSHDMTAYHFTLPAGRWKAALEVEARLDGLIAGVEYGDQPSASARIPRTPSYPCSFGEMLITTAPKL